MKTTLFRKTQQVVIGFALLSVGLLTSCKDDPETYPNLTLEKETHQMSVSDNATVSILTGSGTYTVVSASPAIATATVEGGTAKISAVAEGTAKITVTDTKSKQAKDINITVSQNLTVDALENTTITVGSSKDVAILSGSGNYSVAVDNSSTVSATLADKVIKINALAEGTATITVTDNTTGKKVTITITSEQIPSVYFAASSRWDYRITISAAPEDQPGIWIDLNNNGIKEDGEAVEFFDVEKIYPRNPEMTIHGKVSGLVFTGIAMERLDVSKNRYLKKFICPSQKLATVDFTKNTELEELSIGSTTNTFTSLDLSKNTKLVNLECSSLQNVENLDLSNNKELKVLSCTSTKIKNINFGSISKLERLDAFFNRELEPFSVTAFTELTYLRIAYNTKFTSFFDLSKNTKLVTVVAGGIDLSGATIDFSKNTSLEDIFFYGCKLANANFLSTIPNPEKITKMQFERNQLTALNLSRFVNLTELHCYTNKIAEPEMVELVTSLPTRTSDAPARIVIIDSGRMASSPEGNVYPDTEKDRTKAKFWAPWNFNSGASPIPL